MLSATTQVEVTVCTAPTHDRGVTHPTLDVLLPEALCSLLSFIGRAKCGETFRSLGANRSANRWNPAEQRALRTQRHGRPAPKAETIDVARDQGVDKLEFGIDAVVNRPPCRGKRVPRIPMRAPPVSARAYVAKRDPQVTRATVQHAPHRARLGRRKRAEHRVAEHDIRVITDEHRIDVAAAERAIEPLDERGVRRGSAAAPRVAHRSDLHRSLLCCVNALDSNLAVTSTMGMTRS